MMVQELFVNNPANFTKCFCIALSFDNVIGPYFFESENGASITFTSDRHVDMLKSFFEPNLNYPEDFQDEEFLFQQYARNFILQDNQMKLRGICS